MYEKMLTVGWSDVDMNGHMANTAFLQKSVDVRVAFFDESGFPVSEFQRQRFGPVVRREELNYYRELHLMDPIRSILLLAGLAENGSRFRLRNEFWRSDGELAASVEITGGWLDLAARKLIPPPDKLFATLQLLRKTPDFEVLKSSAGKA